MNRGKNRKKHGINPFKWLEFSSWWWWCFTFNFKHEALHHPKLPSFFPGKKPGSRKRVSRPSEWWILGCFQIVGCKPDGRRFFWFLRSFFLPPCFYLFFLFSHFWLIFLLRHFWVHHFFWSLDDDHIWFQWRVWCWGCRETRLQHDTPLCRFCKRGKVEAGLVEPRPVTSKATCFFFWDGSIDMLIFNS